MESTQIQALYEPPLAAMPQLREKPRQGFETWKTAWKPGPNVPNFTVALGLRAVVVENGVRETYSARYYNPNTGRFLSRDPEDGKPIDPASLHKYLYALGDPVNRIDPRGREAMLQFLFTTASIQSPVTPFEYGLGIGLAVAYTCYANTLYAILHWAVTSEALGPLDLACLFVAGGAGV